MPTPRLSVLPSGGAVPCHATPCPGYDEPTSRERAPVRASPPARIRASVYTRCGAGSEVAGNVRARATKSGAWTRTGRRRRRRRCRCCAPTSGRKRQRSRRDYRDSYPLRLIIARSVVARPIDRPTDRSSWRRRRGTPASDRGWSRRRNVGSSLPALHGVATRSEIPPSETVGLRISLGAGVKIGEAWHRARARVTSMSAGVDLRFSLSLSLFPFCRSRLSPENVGSFAGVSRGEICSREIIEGYI